MLKAIIFDFDGVIADSEPLHYKALLAVAQELGITFDYEEYGQTYIGYDDRDAFRIMLGISPGTRGTPAQESKITQLLSLKAAAFEAVVETGITPIPGILDIIRAASAEKMPIAIASGATRTDIDLVLRKLDLTHLFATIVSASDVEHSKPNPASYQRAVMKLAAKHLDLDITPQDCLAIEDTIAGITSAQKAGLMTLAVATTNPAEILKIANRVIAGPHEITLETLKQWY
jgi:beta-phosphoglucomutase